MSKYKLGILDIKLYIYNQNHRNKKYMQQYIIKTWDSSKRGHHPTSSVLWEKDEYVPFILPPYDNLGDDYKEIYFEFMKKLVDNIINNGQ